MTMITIIRWWRVAYWNYMWL